MRQAEECPPPMPSVRQVLAKTTMRQEKDQAINIRFKSSPRHPLPLALKFGGTLGGIVGWG